MKVDDAADYVVGFGVRVLWSFCMSFRVSALLMLIGGLGLATYWYAIRAMDTSHISGFGGATSPGKVTMRYQLEDKIYTIEADNRDAAIWYAQSEMDKAAGKATDGVKAGLGIAAASLNPWWIAFFVWWLFTGRLSMPGLLSASPQAPGAKPGRPLSPVPRSPVVDPSKRQQ